MQFPKAISGLNRLATLGIRAIFIGLWLSLGAMFVGLFIGAIIGWVSGTVVGENTYGTALVGAASGGIIGIVGVLIVSVGAVFSKNKDEIFGWKSSKLLLVGIPTAILFLFVLIIVTIPIHNFLLSEFIIPVISRPPNVPEKQVPLPDGFVNVFHFSDRADNIFSDISSQFLFEGIKSVIGALIALVVGIGLVISGIREGNIKNFFKATFIVFWGVMWVSLSGSWIKSTIEDKTSSEQTYEHFLSIYESRQYQIVEGPVKVLHVFPPGGHDRGDIIVVDDVEFEISPYYHAFFYDKPIVEGGVLTDGEYVRIYYYEGRILAIDMKPSAE